MDNNLLNSDNFANKKGNYKTPFKTPNINGKLQPQALELEEVVLGALMIEKEAINDVIDILYPDTFYKPAHQEIYNAIKELFQNSEPIDIITVTQKLRSLGKLEFVGGAYVVAELTSRVNSAANIVYHSRLLMQYAIKRALITICSKIETQAFEDTTDVLQLLDAAQQSLFDVSEKNIRKNYMKMKDLMSIALEELEAKKDKKDGLTGVPTGFTDLDQVTSGWQRSDLIILAARPGMGKCVKKNSYIVMFDGTLKKVQDIEVGELLMGDDSTPRKVLSLARGQEKMYWINQNKGIRYGVNESHILSLKRSRTSKKYPKGEVLNISVKDYLEKSNKFKSNYKGYKVAVEFAEKPITIEPYFLGLWLGDGNSGSFQITNTDDEIRKAIIEYGEKLGIPVTVVILNKNPNHTRYKLHMMANREHSFLNNELYNLRLISNKHIPQHYLVNSTENRLSLLAGLLDSDGHYLVDSNGYEITQKNEDLSRQIKFLCDTLGFRTSLTKKKAQITAINYECDVWRVRIYGDIDKIPVKVKRKKARAWASKIDWKVTGITVEFDKIDDYYGFEIDGNRLFLLEDMTVTHNTAFVVSALRNAAVDHQKAVAIFSLEMSAIQLVNRLLSAEAELNSEKIKKGNLMQYEWEQLHSKITRLTEAPIFIDDTPALSVLELRAKARRLKAQHNIELLIVDYLQLMSGGDGGNGKGNREQEIAFISRSLKNIAKELDIPVIALSQLSRAVETRGGDKKPMLSDLRESGCITGDSLIIDARTGALVPIRELSERTEQTLFTCLGANEAYKVTPQNMVKVFYSGKKEVFEVKTRTGKHIKASANHPFMKLEGWTRLDKLKVGDKVATPRNINATNPTNPISKDELILLAHLLGDGCILPRQAYHYTSADMANIEIVQETAKRLFNIQGKTVHQENWWHFYLTSPYLLTHNVKHPITLWYERLGIDRVRSYDKKLPSSIFQSDNEHIALFLKHLWATDGNISWKKIKGRIDAGAIYYGSSSKILAEQVQHLLLRLNIVTTIVINKKEGYKDNYHVWVQGAENQISFLNLVGCYGKRGEIIPEILKTLETIVPNTNLDVTPKEVWKLFVEPAKNAVSKSWRDIAKELNAAYNGSGMLKCGVGKKRLNKIADVLASEKLKNLANSDIYWDEIVSITPLGEQDVYDATVENVHNFVANDFILHNSIEQDADMVIFLYRPEYYKITQDENGMPCENMAEVIIAKHRNGSLDTVKLKFIGEFTKFGNLDNFGFGADMTFSSEPTSFPTTDAPNQFITLASKMNDTKAKPTDNTNENAPF